MPLEEQVLPSESSPFTIRRFVSTVRCKDFSKCWPFSHRILERCLMLGMKVELPPLEPTLNSHMCGRCNISTQLPLNDGSDSIVSCSFGHGSSKEDFAKFDSKDSPKTSRDPAMEKVSFDDTEALNMAVEKVGVNVREHSLATQKPNKAAEIMGLTENLWDNNTADCKPDIISSSASQIVLGTLPDNDGSTNLAGPYTTIAPGTLLLEREIRDCGPYPVVQDESSGVEKSRSCKPAGLHTTSTPGTLLLEREIRDCGPYQVVQDESSGVEKSRSCKPAVGCDTFSEVLHGVRDNLQHSTFAIAKHDVHHGDKESLKAFYKPTTLLKESEPIGYLRGAESNKNSKNFGLLKSNPDASMLQVCPLCLKFSTNSNTALNAHIDHCLILDKADAARPPKQRFKVKKMRSMVDIYVSAPVRTLKDLEMSSKSWSLQRANQRFTRSSI